MAEKIEQLRGVFYEIVGQEEQRRGYPLERFLNDPFGSFDIDAKSPFKVLGE